MFDPREFNNCAIWLDAADATTLVYNGSTIQRWKNKGYAGDAIQNTASAQPTYNATGINSKPAIVFDSNDIISIPYTTALNFTTCSTFVAFQRDTDTGGNQPICGKYDTSGAFRQWNLRVGTGDDILALGSTDGTGGTLVTCSTGVAATISTPFIVGGHYDATNIYAEVQNTKRTAAALASMVQASVAFDVGGGFSSFLNGKIAEVIHYNTVLTKAQQVAVTQYLAKRWGVVIS